MDARDPETRLGRALERLQKLATFNGPHGARLGAESEYGEAYQALVRLGRRRQLRAKYRR